MKIETIEINLDKVDLSNIRQDPLFSHSGREDYLWGLLSHITSAERLSLRQKLRHHDGDLNPLERFNLAGELDKMDRSWLFDRPDRILYCAWDLLGDDVKVRDQFFQVYTQEAFPDQQEAVSQFNSLEQRFIELKNLHTILFRAKEAPSGGVILPPQPDPQPLVEISKPPVFVIKLNSGDKIVSSIKELTAAVVTEQRFTFPPKDLWDMFVRIGGMSEEELQNLPKEETGKRAGWAVIPFGQKWQIYLQNNESGQLIFSLYRKQEK